MTTISTALGSVSGDMSPYDSRIRVFRGIPYAAPPIGENRFKPPQPASPWQGVREATQFSASCFQDRHTSGFVWRREDFAISEDCLYLNIWSPQDADNLPVMVWFHGGAHTSGQGHSKIFDGTRLSQEDVVVVTINYRLGAFGFLAHPWLAEESAHGAAGNYGLMDKIAALQWVQDNIAAFGGNRDNVTIFGQSAGSQSVCSLMASPLTTGLFHRAIGQSASGFMPPVKRDPDGRDRGQKLVMELGAATPAELRKAPAANILRAANSSGWANYSRIVVDGHVLTESERETFRQGKQAKVPLMVGSLANEGNELIPKNDNLTADELDDYLARTFADNATQMKALYSDYETPGAIQHAIATDMFMAFGMRRWAEYQTNAGSPTFLYYMDHVPPAFHLYMPDQPELSLPGGPRSGGAYHSGDLAYVFGNVGLVGVDWNDDDKQLSELMVRYWTNFAKTGSPASGNTPPWPQFTIDRRQTQRLSLPVSSEDGILKEQLDAIGATFSP